MIDYSNLKHHQLSEEIIDAICNQVGTSNRTFFRVHLAYYMSVMASMMRTNVQLPGQAAIPVSFFAINLAPSGFGKGHSTSIIEDQIINQFQARYLDETFPLLAEENLPKLAYKRAAQAGTDPNNELERIKAEFKLHGELMFSFDSATPAAIKQMRSKLLMANAGSMNLQTDEIGTNFSKNKEEMALYLELFNGAVKQKLVKNTTEQIRSADLTGITPANMMGFGIASSLLDGGKTEDEFIAMLEAGYARRTFFGFVTDSSIDEREQLTPEEKLAQLKSGIDTSLLKAISDKFSKLVNKVNSHKTLEVPDETALMYLQYEIDCKTRASEVKSEQHLIKSEMVQRPFKTLKLAGTYAFVDSSCEVTPIHFEAAIAMAEESGHSFYRIIKRDKAYVKFAKYLATVKEEINQADLIDALPFYKGTKSVKQDLVTNAIAWGYSNNIIIKRRFMDGIEFFRGETLKPTDTTKLRFSYSRDIVEGYENVEAPFDQLHKLTQTTGLHWINHHLENGHRCDDNCIAGFNCVIIDIDGGITLPLAKTLLEGYKAHYYTTKRHTDENHRFRIVMPTNYELYLPKDDFKEFMKNLYEWLPFDSDTQTGQRARKWLSFGHYYENTEGKLLDVLPFIPKTTKNEERRKQYDLLHSLDNLERWVIQNTGDGNRNNQLLRYAYILLDGGFDFEQIRTHVFAMNGKLGDQLPESEIVSSILSTIQKQIDRRQSL